MMERQTIPHDNKNNYFRSKADTLIWLEPRIRRSRVLPCYAFSTEAWKRGPEQILDEICARFSVGPVIVRSSAAVEDRLHHSTAGVFASIPRVPSFERRRLAAAIHRVAASYPEHPANQILVQPYLEGCDFAGVVSSHLVSDGRPYYVFSEEHGGGTNGVTGGTDSGEAIFLRREAPSPELLLPRHLRPVLRAMRELERLFDGTPIQAEYACVGTDDIVLFQVRPLVGMANPQSPTPTDLTRGLRKEIECALADDPELPGVTGMLGLMPDWNPAELLGDHPRPLTLSLYRTLIAKGVWCRARAELGYQDLREADFLHVLSGRPYINARTSFRSFLPAGLNLETQVRLVSAWIARLRQRPALHDSIEFEVVPTCADFEFEMTFQHRYEGVLDAKASKDYKKKLSALTLNLLRYPVRNDLSFQRQHCVANSTKDIPTLEDLVERTIRFGSLPFARVARLGFVAEALLRSAVRRGAIAPDREQEFRHRIQSVGAVMAQDSEDLHRGDLTRTAFMERYGHLRPSSFDILSPCYRDRRWSNAPAGSTHWEIMPPFILTSAERAALRWLLKENGFADLQPDALMEWLREAIAGREWSKYHFSVLLSELLEQLTDWGARRGFTAEELSFLDLDCILLADATAEDMFPRLRRCIDTAVVRRRKEKEVFLGPIISAPREADCFRLGEELPHFVGNGVVRAPALQLNQHTVPSKILRGCIVCIRQADPGFDWIFTKGIAGLVTAYGGPNSHMAVRCAELGLPAAIGCGEFQFDKLVGQGVLRLDCARRRVTGVKR